MPHFSTYHTCVKYVLDGARPAVHNDAVPREGRQPQPGTLGAEIRRLRQDVFGSADKFAVAIGVTRQQVLAWELNRNTPNSDSEERIRAALGGPDPPLFAEARGFDSMDLRRAYELRFEAIEEALRGAGLLPPSPDGR